ncbi:MAG: hypothetical protein A2Y36_00270 [Treponema sp. GWA1_62_8]|nr:MAG: hypothetical protein A2Y36_00270 [Treponema sp. GWA1_62_8]OHE66751.1 MAG: hypothetical protein A2001_02425 [Treponema sp. GWC1_61_84]
MAGRDRIFLTDAPIYTLDAEFAAPAVTKVLSCSINSFLLRRVNPFRSRSPVPTVSPPIWGFMNHTILRLGHSFLLMYAYAL